jgi:hypothetical protein
MRRSSRMASATSTLIDFAYVAATNELATWQEALQRDDTDKCREAADEKYHGTY